MVVQGKTVNPDFYYEVTNGAVNFVLGAFRISTFFFENIFNFNFDLYKTYSHNNEHKKCYPPISVVEQRGRLRATPSPTWILLLSNISCACSVI